MNLSTKRTRCRMDKHEEPHAVVIVPRGSEKVCGTCAHFREMRFEHEGVPGSCSTALVCTIKPSEGRGITRTGLRGVRKETNVCDLWKER